MPTERKAKLIAELEDLVSRSTVTISASYRGMSVAEMTTLRRRMREAGVELRVVKNTLFRMAAERGGKPELSQITEGPTALVFGFGGPNEPAVAIGEYIRSSRTTLTLSGAYYDGQILPSTGVAELATLPTRPQLLSQFMGDLQSPLATLAGLLSATLRDFAGLVEARSNQVEANPA